MSQKEPKTSKKSVLGPTRVNGTTRCKEEAEKRLSGQRGPQGTSPDSGRKTPNLTARNAGQHRATFFFLIKKQFWGPHRAARGILVP